MLTHLISGCHGMTIKLVLCLFYINARLMQPEQHVLINVKLTVPLGIPDIFITIFVQVGHIQYFHSALINHT